MYKTILSIVAIGIAIFILRKASSKMKEETFLIARTIFAESLGEPFEGKIAVGNVIHNRYLSKRNKEFGETYKEIIFKENQFSGVGGPLWDKIEKPKLMSKTEKQYFNKCIAIAKEVVDGTIGDNTKGATFYYNPDKADPDWDFSLLEKTVEIGNHHFYKYK